MKQTKEGNIKLPVFLIAPFILIASCFSELNYADFQDKNAAGKVNFQTHSTFCDEQAGKNSVRPEGSQRAGERLIEKRNQFLQCMAEKGWTKK